MGNMGFLKRDIQVLILVLVDNEEVNISISIVDQTAHYLLLIEVDGLIIAVDDVPLLERNIVILDCLILGHVEVILRLASIVVVLF